MLPLATASLPELEALCRSLAIDPTRAARMLRWVHARLEPDPGSWAELGRAERSRIGGATAPGLPLAIEEAASPDGSTERVVYRLADGATVEAVLMRPPGRVPAMCVSSQAGCGMACTFCATGAMGLTRNLTAAEIAGQVYDLRRRLKARGLAPDRHNLLFMGMGEPLANRAGTFGALEMLTDKARFGMSPRRIVVSTIGVVEGIRALGELGIPVVLAVSLHAVEPALRTAIMPVTGKVPIGTLLDEASAYAARSRRPLVLEYILLPGVNDSEAAAAELGRQGKRRRALVNLIPFNPVGGTPYRRPTPAEAQAFRDRVAAEGALATVRWSRGTEVEGGCGQLAARVAV